MVVNEMVIMSMESVQLDIIILSIFKPFSPFLASQALTAWISAIANEKQIMRFNSYPEYEFTYIRLKGKAYEMFSKCSDREHVRCWWRWFFIMRHMMEISYATL